METEIENHIDQKHKFGGKMSTIEHNATHQATAVACVTKTLMINTTDHAERMIWWWRECQRERLRKDEDSKYTDEELKGNEELKRR